MNQNYLTRHRDLELMVIQKLTSLRVLVLALHSSSDIVRAILYVP